MAADLGYGPTGPKNIQQLTLPELRTFAEGIRRETERQNQRFSGESDGGRDRPKGQPRESDKEMARELQEELEAQDGPPTD